MAPALEGTNFEANRRPAPDLNISGPIASFRPHFAPGADFSTPVITNAVLSADDLPSLPALALRRLPDARGGNRRAAVPARLERSTLRTPAGARTSTPEWTQHQPSTRGATSTVGRRGARCGDVVSGGRSLHERERGAEDRATRE